MGRHETSVPPRDHTTYISYKGDSLLTRKEYVVETMV